MALAFTNINHTAFDSGMAISNNKAKYINNSLRYKVYKGNSLFCTRTSFIATFSGCERAYNTALAMSVGSRSFPAWYAVSKSFDCKIQLTLLFS